MFSKLNFVAGTETPTLTQLTEQSWVWLVDLERTCSYLIGRIIGSMLVGDKETNEELQCRFWLKNVIFSCGLRDGCGDIQCIDKITDLILSDMHERIPVIIDELSAETQMYCKLALKLPDQYDDACGPQEVTDLYDTMLEVTDSEVWKCGDFDNRLMETVERCFLTTLIKHTGLLATSSKHPAIAEIYRIVSGVRLQLLTSKFKLPVNKDGKLDFIDESTNGIIEAKEIRHDLENDEDSSDYHFKNMCKRILERCLFLLLFVSGKCFHCDNYLI